MILLSSAFSTKDFSTLNFKQCLVTPKICYSGKLFFFRFPVTFPLFKLNLLNCILIFHKHIQKHIFVHLNSDLLGIASIFYKTSFPIDLKYSCIHSKNLCYTNENTLHWWPS